MQNECKHAKQPQRHKTPHRDALQQYIHTKGLQRNVKDHKEMRNEYKGMQKDYKETQWSQRLKTTTKRCKATTNRYKTTTLRCKMAAKMQNGPKDTKPPESDIKQAHWDANWLQRCNTASKRHNITAKRLKTTTKRGTTTTLDAKHHTDAKWLQRNAKDHKEMPKLPGRDAKWSQRKAYLKQRDSKLAQWDAKLKPWHFVSLSVWESCSFVGGGGKSVLIVSYSVSAHTASPCKAMFRQSRN